MKPEVEENQGPPIILLANGLSSRDRLAFGSAAGLLEATVLAKSTSPALDAAHGRILNSFGLTKADPRPTDYASIDATRKKQAREQLLEALEPSLATIGVVVVDLRQATKLLPLWIEVLEHHSITPRFVHLFRSAADAASLLQSEDSTSFEMALESWRQLVLAHERESRDHLRYTLKMDELAGDTVRSLQNVENALEFRFTIPPAQARSGLEVSAETRHRDPVIPANAEAALPSWCRPLERAALRKTAGKATLDIFATETNTERFTPTMALEVASDLTIEVRSELRTRTQRINSRSQALERAKDNVVHRLNDVDRTLLEVHQRIGSRHELLSGSIGDLATTLDAQNTQLQRLAKTSETATTQTEHQSLKNALQQLDNKTKNTPAALNQLRDRLNDLATTLDAQNTQLQRLTKTSETATTQTERSSSQLADLEERRVAFELETRTRIAELNSNVDETTAGLRHSLAAQDERAAERNATAQRSIDVLHASLEKATAALDSALLGQEGLLLEADHKLSATEQRLTKLEHSGEVVDSTLREHNIEVEHRIAQAEQRILDVVSAGKASDDDAVRGFTAEFADQLQLLTTSMAAKVKRLEEQYNYELRRVLDRSAEESTVQDLMGRVAELETRLAAQPAAPQAASDEMAMPPHDDVILSFPVTPAPKVSVIIPAFNHTDVTLACLRSLAKHLPTTSIEVLVANDRSTEPAFEQLRTIPGVVVVDTPANVGFGGNCNNAASRATGEFLFFLNNDAQVTPGTIDALVETFDLFPKTGIAGSKLLFPDESVQDGGGIIWRDGSAWNYGRSQNANEPTHNYCRAVDYVAGAALMVRKSTFDNFGGFDDLFAPAYYEDTDLCMKVATSGLEVRYQPTSVVLHNEGTSYGTDVSQQGKHHQVLNREKFFRRWSEALLGHRLNGQDPELEKERHVDSRVLVIDARMLSPDKDSGSLRMSNLLRILTLEGHKVTFIPMNLGETHPHGDDLRKAGIEVITSPFAVSVDSFLRQRGSEFDVVMLSRMEVANEHLNEVEKFCPDARIVFDTVDLHFLRERRELELTGRSSLPRSYLDTYEAETNAMQLADATLVVSTAEMELLRSEPLNAEVHLVSNVHNEACTTTTFDNRSNNILFVGGFEHPPNTDGITWFVENVFPLVLEADPGVQLDIVGSKMTDQIRALAGPAVKVHGYVNNLSPLYEQSKAVVAPIRYGAGVKGKVTQALARGVPVIATQAAAEGMPVVDGIHLAVADEPQDFADQILRILQDETRWGVLRSGGLECIEENYSFNAVGQRLMRALDLPAMSHYTEGNT